MTTNPETPRLVVAGNATRGPFTLSVSGTPITYAAGAELALKRYDTDNALVGTLVSGVDYALSADSRETGQAAATFTLDATEAVLETGESIVVERVTTKSSNFALASTGGIFEAALDKLTRIIQELFTAIGRGVTSHPLFQGSLQFPLPEAGAFLGWNDDEDELVNYSGVADVAVSAAMAPVVGAGSIAAARALMDLYSTAAVDALLAGKVGIAGAETITGLKTFSTGGDAFSLNSTTTEMGFAFRQATVRRWHVLQGSTGDTFLIRRYSSGGGFLDTPLGITAGGVLQTLGCNVLYEVDTKAALKALATGATDLAVFVRGRTTAHDGGGGVFRWNPANLSTQVTNDPQEGIYVAPTAASTGASGAWVREYAGAVNLAWWNGTATNIGTALQAAVNFVKWDGGGDILIPEPPGSATRWELSAAITADGSFDLTITGIGRPQIFQTAAANAFTVGTDGVSQQSAVKFRNLDIWSDHTGLIGVRAFDLTTLKFEDCNLYKWGTGGIYASSCYATQIINTRIVDDSASPAASGYGLKLDEASANNASMRGGGVLGFLGASARGIVVVGDAFGFNITGVDFEENVTDIELENDGGGLSLDGLNVDGCYFERYDIAGARAIRTQSGVAAKNIAWRNCQFLNKYVDIVSCDGVTEDSNTYHWNSTVISLGGSVTNWRLGNSRFPNGGTVTVPDNREWQRVGAWQSFTPTWTAASGGAAIGDGSLTGYYKRAGNTVHYRIRLAWGSTTNGGTGVWSFALPFTARTLSGALWFGLGYYKDNGTADVLNSVGPSIASAATTLQAKRNSDYVGLAATVPITWANGDELHLSGTYECA